MNIVVCVKRVPDTAADKKLDPQDFTLDRESVDSIINPVDEYAVEEALRLKEQHGGEVAVLTMGPGGAEKNAVRKALALGADRGVLVSDERLHGSDAMATAHVLAKALGGMEFDLVLMGSESTDARTSLVPQDGSSGAIDSADRLDEQAFFANGRRFAFDMQLGNVRGDMPIHGFVTTTDRWNVVETKADTEGARVTSRLPERDADDLSLLLGDQHEVTLQELRRDLGPRPRTVPVHRPEQLQHRVLVGRGRLAHVHASSLRSE